MREEYRKIASCIDKNKIVSFDVFDTLLLRVCTTPTDIFSLYRRKNMHFLGSQKEE